MMNIHTFTGGIAQTNAWLVESPGGSLLVDAPEGTARWLLARGARVEALLLTHQHFDHVQDAARIKAEHGCSILAWSPFSRILTLENLVGGGHELVPEYQVDEVLDGRGQLEVGGLAWNLLHVPGHSPDSLCFHQPEASELFGGDVLFLDGIGRTDFPGGSLEQLMTGIREKVLVLPDETRIRPGHGPATTIGRERHHNPFLSQD